MVAEWRWQSSTSRPARQPLKAVNFRAKAGWLVWSGLVGEPEGLLLLAASAHWFKMGKISQKLVHFLWFHKFWSNKFHLIDIISVSGGYMHFIFKNLSNCWWHKYDPSIPRVFFFKFLAGFYLLAQQCDSLTVGPLIFCGGWFRLVITANWLLQAQTLETASEVRG